MANNKFIERLKGKPTAGSLVEIKNTRAKTSFADMPVGSSNAVDVFSDHRDNATIVANGTLLWKVDGETLESVESVFGDGKDFLSVQSVAGSGLWLNASYTFPSTGDPNHPVAMVFNPNTKWVLKLCGDSLIVDGGNVLDFTLIVKIGSAHIFSKNFKVAEHAGQFSTELILDFDETNAGIVKAGGLAKLTLQLLCGTDNASARIYNGMTVLTCLQRKVDASAVSSKNINVQDVLDGTIIPDDYFSNPEFIDQIEDGKDAYAVFNRDGDSVNLAGWTPKDKFIVKSDVMPTPTSALTGYVFQYVGETNNTYHHGYIYECQRAQMNMMTFTPDVMSCSWADLSVFLATQSADYDSVTNGTMTYFADADLRRLDAKDAQGNTVVSYQQYTGDWENVGFVFSGTFEDGDVVSFVRNTEFDYVWERVDLQPNHEQDIIEIREEIEDLKGLGRFLSVWNCATGLAETNPPESPYTYHTGDYFLVGTVGTTNYRPNGSTYTTGVPSTTVETEVVKVNDVYIYDGTNWKLQANSQRDVTFGGIVGNPYDNTALATALNEKQNTISDLATIRSNAQAGRTASNTIATYGNIVTHNVSEFATAAQGALADTAVQPGDLATVATSGSYNDLSNKPTIPTVNNPTITITQGGVTKGTFTLNQASGDTIALDAGGGGIGNIDNLTITANADQEIQTVATINPNPATGATNPIYDWVGTLAEYNAQNIETLHPDWVCFITDDLSAEAYEAYTKGESLNLFVQKGHQVIEFQAPTSANGYTWYRKYADGWVEQGGLTTILSAKYIDITLPIPMQDNHYSPMITANWSSSATGQNEGYDSAYKTNTTMRLTASYANVIVCWQVSGMAA